MLHRKKTLQQHAEQAAGKDDAADLAKTIATPRDFDGARLWARANMVV
jgi:hypothetical protein